MTLIASGASAQRAFRRRNTSAKGARRVVPVNRGRAPGVRANCYGRRGIFRTDTSVLLFSVRGCERCANAGLRAHLLRQESRAVDLCTLAFVEHGEKPDADEPDRYRKQRGRRVWKQRRA